MKKNDTGLMFIGTIEHTMDSKGRVSIPAKFRETLEKKFDDRLIITRGEESLDAYPVKIWQEFTDKVMALPQMRKDIMAFLRFYMGGAEECSIDKQGRILIPPALREYAGLNKDVVFVGISRRFEIWDKKKWEASYKKIVETIQLYKDSLATLGI